MRVCPFPGCVRVIRPELFACPAHWYSLSAEQQGRIWAAYGEYQRDGIDLGELRRVQKQVIDEAHGVRKS